MAPFGYGKTTYVWSLIVALLAFSVGGGVSTYEGIVSVAALIGIVSAALGVWLSRALSSPLLDPVACVRIGLVLIPASALLARKAWGGWSVPAWMSIKSSGFAKSSRPIRRSSA